MLRSSSFGMNAIIVGALVLAACEEPPQITQIECRGVVQYLSLPKADYDRCIRDGTYRAELSGRRDKDLAPRLVKGHNTEMTLLSLQGRDPSDFARLGSINALPVEDATLSGKSLGKHAGLLTDEAMIGKRFRFDARITFDEEAAMSEGAPPFVTITLLGPDGQRVSGVGGNSLNDYQRLFLRKYCGLASLPLCDGEVFVEFMKEPPGFYIRGELVGANIKPASVEAAWTAMRNLSASLPIRVPR